MQVLDAENEPLDEPIDWYANGTFGPSLNYDHTATGSDLMYIFFTGVYGDVRWTRIALRRLLSLKNPPFPAPFYFAVGRLTCRPSTIVPA